MLTYYDKRNEDEGLALVIPERERSSTRSMSPGPSLFFCE